MSTAITSPARLSTTLSAVACLVATAALVRAAGTAGVADVRVVVAGGRVSVQVPLSAGEQATRMRAVAAYAQVLGSQVTDRDGRTGTRGETWVETVGRIDGYEVHVWTITDPDREATGTGKER